MYFDTPPRQVTLPYSFGIDRAILQVLSEVPEDVEVNLTEVVKDAFILVYPLDQIKKHLTNLVKQTEARIAELNKQAENKQPPSPISVKTMGTSYAEWVGGLTAEESCLYLADNDPNKAYHFFWYTEMDYVEDALKQKMEQTSQQMIAQMEASMYGFGGKYGNDESHANAFDLSAGQGLDVLKQMGF